MLALLLICGGFAYYILARPIPPIPAGKIIDRLGTYVSPNGTCIAEISTNSSGQLVIEYNEYNMQEETGAFYVRPKPGIWFATIDGNDRLWLYIEGGGSLGQDVLCRATRNRTKNEVASVGSGGGWEGIPDSFFERLPETEIKKYEIWKKKQQIK